MYELQLSMAFCFFAPIIEASLWFMNKRLENTSIFIRLYCLYSHCFHTATLLKLSKNKATEQLLYIYLYFSLQQIYNFYQLNLINPKIPQEKNIKKNRRNI